MSYLLPATREVQYQIENLVSFVFFFFQVLFLRAGFYALVDFILPRSPYAYIGILGYPPHQYTKLHDGGSENCCEFVDKLQQSCEGVHRIYFFITIHGPKVQPKH